MCNGIARHLALKKMMQAQLLAFFFIRLMHGAAKVALHTFQLD
jgi:hypothetical protein